jgi:uncharacterized coiled-coil DUF342 family protein
LSESLEKIIGKLNQELASVREERDRLNLEAKEWAKKRDFIHDQIKKLRTEAGRLKEERDILNKKVHELKSLREQAKLKREEKRAQLLKLKGNIEGLVERKPSRRMSNIQKELEKIEWKIQTTSLQLKEEELLIDQVRQLEAQLSVYKRIGKSKEKLMVLRTEENALDTEVRTCHEKMSELAEQSQEFHEEMLENLNEARNLEPEADSAHQKYLEIKQQAQNLHQKYVELLDKVKASEKERQEAEEEKQAKYQHELLNQLEERAIKKLKRGEKLTWEEFKILAEKKKI